MQGRSFVPMLKGKSPEDWRKAQLYTYWGGAPNHYGIRTNRYTYVKVDGSDRVELFDRQTDPEQNKNIATQPGNAGLLQELETELQTQLKAAKLPVDLLPGSKGSKAKDERKR